MIDFAAIDFEGANRHLSSICSVGLVIVRGGQIVDRFYSLVKPEPNYYEWGNTRVHGLKRKDTEHSPIFPEVWRQIAPRLELSEADSQLLSMPCLPLVAHNKVYDENCLKAAMRCYQMDYPDYQFFDTYLRARKLWTDGPFTLDGVAERVGHPMTQHHNALADAEACAYIAMEIL